jgi:hypothetical protein
MKIFIVPYRNRAGQLNVFLNHMKYLLEDISQNKYRIYIVHQADSRPFNRGAMRNIGFLEGKKEFPDTYKEIDFVFHDLDNLVGKKNLVEFTTKNNEVNHIYGNYQENNLGGIFVMKGADYEKSGGYPNFWGWGSEDELLGYRCRDANLTIVRNMFSLKDTRMVHLDHTANCPATMKNINTFNKMAIKQRLERNIKIADGLFSLKNINVSRKNVAPSIEMINVSAFMCNISEKNYRPKNIWMISTNFSNFLKKYIHTKQFKVIN